MQQSYPYMEKTIEKLPAKVEFKQQGKLVVDSESKHFAFSVDIKNVGLTDMTEFTVMSAQASVEASFDDPLIQDGYGFSYFGPKGYTFSPIFARDQITVKFMGRFLEELPGEKFTIVLKKVTGHEAVPLFQTLTFYVEQAHLDEDFNVVPEIMQHSSMLGGGISGEALINLFQT